MTPTSRLSDELQKNSKRLYMICRPGCEPSHGGHRRFFSYSSRPCVSSGDVKTRWKYHNRIRKRSAHSVNSSSSSPGTIPAGARQTSRLGDVPAYTTNSRNPHRCGPSPDPKGTRLRIGSRGIRRRNYTRRGLNVRAPPRLRVRRSHAPARPHADEISAAYFARRVCVCVCASRLSRKCTVVPAGVRRRDYVFFGTTNASIM